ncbi:MAG: EAL domain-containing protein, partial [Pseudoalteromonas sp.]
QQAKLNTILLPCSSLLLEKEPFLALSRLLNKIGPVVKKICLLFNEQEIRYASTSQSNNLSTLKKNGYTIGLNDFAKNRCELNLISEHDFDYILLSSTFSKRILQERSYSLQLQGVLAITKIKAIKVIAKGPSILNFRTLLDKHGLALFVGKQHVLNQLSNKINHIQEIQSNKL